MSLFELLELLLGERELAAAPRMRFILDRGDSKLVGNRKPKLERSNGTWSLSDFLSAALTGPLSANKSAAVLYTFVLSGPQTQLLNKLLTQSGE